MLFILLIAAYFICLGYGRFGFWIIASSPSRSPSAAALPMCYGAVLLSLISARGSLILPTLISRLFAEIAFMIPVGVVNFADVAGAFSAAVLSGFRYGVVDFAEVVSAIFAEIAFLIPVRGRESR